MYLIVSWGHMRNLIGGKVNNTFVWTKTSKKLFLQHHVVEIALGMCSVSISTTKKTCVTLVRNTPLPLF